MTEIWRDSISLSGMYQVSNLGRVKRIPREVNKFHGRQILKERIMEFKPELNEYAAFVFKIDGAPKKFYVHRLVAEVFIPNPNGYPHINHKDGRRRNNHVENLEWCTHQQNMKHAMDSGLNSCKRSVVAELAGFGFWFPSLEVAKQFTGVSKPCICAAAMKRQKTAGGMIWGYC